MNNNLVTSKTADKTVEALTILLTIKEALDLVKDADGLKAVVKQLREERDNMAKLQGQIAEQQADLAKKMLTEAKESKDALDRSKQYELAAKQMAESAEKRDAESKQTAKAWREAEAALVNREVLVSKREEDCSRREKALGIAEDEQLKARKENDRVREDLMKRLNMVKLAAAA